MQGYNSNRYRHNSNSTYSNSTRDNVRNRRYNNYISDNLARDYSRVEVDREDKEWLREIYRNRDRENALEQRAREQRTRRLEQSRSISFKSCLALVAVVGVLLYLAVGYLNVRSDVRTLNNKILTKEAEYNNLKDKNDSNLKEIEASVDLRKIYNVATKDLGMVFADDNKIVTYEDKESAYVRQYEDIEDEYEDNVWDDIANVVD